MSLVDSLYRYLGTSSYLDKNYIKKVRDLINSMKFIDSPEIYQQKDIFEGTESTTRLLFKWFKINELEDVELYPRFLRTALRNIPSNTEHVVVRD